MKMICTLSGSQVFGSQTGTEHHRRLTQLRDATINTKYGVQDEAKHNRFRLLGEKRKSWLSLWLHPFRVNQICNVYISAVDFLCFWWTSCLQATTNHFQSMLTKHLGRYFTISWTLTLTLCAQPCLKQVFSLLCIYYCVFFFLTVGQIQLQYSFTSERFSFLI